MRQHLTKKLLENAEIREKPYRISDAGMPGLYLRVQPTGRKIWIVEHKRKTRTVGQYPVMTVAMAREKARRVITGAVDFVTASRIPTLQQFIDEYFGAFARTNYSKPKEAISYLTRTGFTSRRLDEIRIIDAEKYRSRRLDEGIKPATINRQLAILKAALQKAVDWEIIDKNPLARFKQLKLDAVPVVRYLSTSEEKRLHDALGLSEPWVRAFTITALNTGCRRAELWQLAWGDVDFRKKILTIHGKGAKSGQTRHIPLNAKAVETLKQWRGGTVPMKSLPVFGQREFKKSWATLMRLAEIDGFTFHCCRHHFASKLVMAGIPLNTVRELLGHADLKVTMRYAHLAPDNLREAVEVL